VRYSNATIALRSHSKVSIICSLWQWHHSQPSCTIRIFIYIYIIM